MFAKTGKIEMNELDGYSKKLLRELQLDSRRSMQDLSARVGLSGTPCWRRVREMEESGLIRRYTVLLDREMLGLHVCCLVSVNLQRHVKGAIQEFEKAIGECPEVIECFSATGEADYLLKVVAPDIKAFDVFLNQVLFTLPGVANVRTSVVLREVKYETALPV
jgi:Lrp/AsnC family leucine-responsive transcriptional regulator